MTGILYAVAEIAVFMIAALVIGFLLGRVTKRSAPKVSLPGGNPAELAAAQATMRELESERSQLREQLRDAKERARLLAAESTQADFAEEKRALEEKLSEAEARADRLRATIAERDKRIASLSSGDAPEVTEAESGSVGYSHSAGSFAETRIIFSEEDE